MPIKLDNKLPALDVLRSENVFIMDENRASSQDIRPMEVLILNLMPTKEVTELNCYSCRHTPLSN